MATSESFIIFLIIPQTFKLAGKYNVRVTETAYPNVISSDKHGNYRCPEHVTVVEVSNTPANCTSDANCCKFKPGGGYCCLIPMTVLVDGSPAPNFKLSFHKKMNLNLDPQRAWFGMSNAREMRMGVSSQSFRYYNEL